MDSDRGQRVLFEVSTTLGFRVRVTRSYWELITTIKHPVMAGQESVVKETLQTPAQIRMSHSDASVYLFTGRSEPVDGSVRWQKGLTVKAF
jgi:hypothetical protein